MTDDASIRATVLDYFEGWYDADASRMERALHPELVKRWAGDSRGEALGRVLDKTTMVTKTEQGGGHDARPTDADPFDIEVCDAYGGIATVVVRSPEYREYLHLVHTADGWRIVDAFFRYTELEG